MIELVEDLSAYGQIESETFKFGVGKFPWSVKPLNRKHKKKFLR